MVAHHLLQSLRRPILVEVDFEPLTAFHLAQHPANLRKYRPRSDIRLRVVEIATSANVTD